MPFLYTVNCCVWFLVNLSEGTGYQNGVFYDNEAENCPGWPWPENSCMTPTNTSTVGKGYLTSELGNRTIEWIKKVSSEEESVRRPWFVYFAVSTSACSSTSFGQCLSVWLVATCADACTTRTCDASRLVQRCLPWGAVATLTSEL